MSEVKKNVTANFIGQGWAALMGLVFIPLYIQYLGIEAYGLIGLFAVMQAWLILLDMGMAPVISREMARFTAGAHTSQSIRDLLRSLEIIVFSVSTLIGFILWLGSDWLASDWLKADSLPTPVVAEALTIISLVIALRFCEGIYRSALIGLQRQVWLNGANALLATLRHGGAVAILAFLSPTIQAFFIWQAVISILVLGTYATKLYRLLPRTINRARFSSGAIKSVWCFAGGMLAINVLAVLLTQVDKVLLSRLLSLENFGYYILAGTLAGVLPMLVAPVVQSIYPRMVQLHSQDNLQGLARIYHQGAQLVTIFTAPITALLFFFAYGIIYAWTGNADLASSTVAILPPLVLGSFLNGLMWMPYHCQLAHGWTSLGVKTNIVAVILFVPAILWVVPLYGAVGAAWVWVALNAGYVIVAAQIMYGYILSEEKWSWYSTDVLLPAGGTFGVVLLLQTMQPEINATRLEWIVFIAITGCMAFITAVLFSNRIRPLLHQLFAHLLRQSFQEKA